MRVIQVNLGKSKPALDLLMQTARERGADLLLFSEQCRKPGSSVWYVDTSGRSGIQLCNPNLTVGEFRETNNGFVWVEVAGVRIYSCYFSPNVHIGDFEANIQALEDSLRACSVDSLIVGDFNAKSPEWGETRLDRRGVLVNEMVARNDLIVVNRGQEFTFRRGAVASILDLTIASPRLARRIRDWGVLDEVTLSDHQYIEFTVSEDGPKRGSSRSSGRKRPSWNIRRLDVERLKESLEAARLIDELGWTKQPQGMEQIVSEARHAVIAACDHSMPRRGRTGNERKPIYWWSDELAQLRKECHSARRRFTRSKGDPLLQAEWHSARKILKRAIRRSQLRCWKDLIGDVENDPWGLAFKIVTKKLVTRHRPPGSDNPDWVLRIIRGLFPRAEKWTREDYTSCLVQREELFTLEELKHVGKALRSGKAPGIDGIPNEILKMVIEVYPEILLNAFNACLSAGEFFSDWKKQRLVLLRKGSKPLDEISSFRPLCLLDTMGKLLEGLVLHRLQNHLVGLNSLSDGQYGFRKGMSTIDAILAVVDKARMAKEGWGARKKGFCALVSIDIRNAFNSARWDICIEAIRRKGVPTYLLRMMDNYLRDRWVVYEGNTCHLVEEMTCGAPQGSKVGPFVWNVMYDDFLRMVLPEDTSIFCFADDAIIVCSAEDPEILGIRVNESLRRAKQWLDSRCLQMALDKTEALLVTDKRLYESPKIEMDGIEVPWGNHLKYLGVMLDRRLSFVPHIDMMTKSAIKCGGSLSRLMPNIGGPREVKRRLVASVVHSKLLYAAPVWVSALQNRANSKRLLSAQRLVALRIVSAYRTVSTSAVQVLASLPPVDLLARERQEVFLLNKQRVSSQGVNCQRSKEVLRKEARHRLVLKWQERWNEGSTGRWTYRLIPHLSTWLERKHGEVGYYLTQALSGHGCFGEYLCRFKKRDEEKCVYCDDPLDNAEHTLFTCEHWTQYRRVMFTEVGTEVTPENMITLMVEDVNSWRHIESFITQVMRTKDLDGRELDTLI